MSTSFSHIYIYIYIQQCEDIKLFQVLSLKKTYRVKLRTRESIRLIYSRKYLTATDTAVPVNACLPFPN